MTTRGKIAALVADAFQEEEYFFPKVALQEAGTADLDKIIAAVKRGHQVLDSIH
jgi:hypothetical protein